MTRRDGHPTRRKLYMWDEAEWILNNIMYDEAEELWLEMQIWEQNTLLQYYKGGNSKSLCEVKGRLTEVEKSLLARHIKFIKIMLRNLQGLVK